MEKQSATYCLCESNIYRFQVFPEFNEIRIVIVPRVPHTDTVDTLLNVILGRAKEINCNLSKMQKIF